MTDGQTENQRLVNVLRFRDSFYLFGIFFSLSAVYLFFIFAPTIDVSFAHHDDYLYWAYDNRHRLGLHPQFAFLVIIGRGLFNLISYPVTKLVHTVSDLWKLRMITVASCAVSTALFALWIHKLTSNKSIAFFISACVFTLPAIQVFVFWSSFGLYTVAILCALVSAMLIDAANPRILLRFKAFKQRDGIYALLSLGFLIMSLYIYQPLSMFYLTASFAQILFSDTAVWPQTRIKALRNLGLFGLGCLLYFSFHRFVFLPAYFAKFPGRESLYLNEKAYQFSVTTDPLAKIWSFYDASIASFNLWNIYSNRAIAYFVAALILTGAIVSGVRLFLSGRKERRFVLARAAELVVITAAWLVMVNSTILLPSGGHLAFRLLFGYSAILVIALCWAIMELMGLLPERLGRPTIFTVLSLMMIGSGVLAQRNTLATALNSHAELSFIRAKIARHLNDRKFIHVIRSESDRSVLNLPARGDEFNRSSSQYPQDIHLMVRSVLLELVRDNASVGVYPTANSKESITASPKNSIVVTSSLPGEPIKAPHNALIIDMNQLLVPLVSFRCGDFFIQARRNGDHDQCRAFDGNNQPDSFWETSGPFPIMLDLTYRSGNEKVFKYSLQTGPLPDGAAGRMPQAWKFQGSNESSRWNDLDEKRDQTGWQVGETRTYYIKHPDTFKRYRFVFTEGITPQILRIYEITMYKTEGQR